MKYREPLDLYDIKPTEMIAYFRYNGAHLNKKLYEWAVRQMRTKNGKIEPLSKEEIESKLKANSVTIENNSNYDFCYVYMMCMADFYGSSITTEKSLAQFVKDYVDDVDQADGFIFNRLWADCVHNGTAIPWEEVV